MGVGALYLPAAKAKYHVKLAPPSIQPTSKFDCEKKFHAAVGSMMARFAYRMPLQPPATESTLPFENTVSHSSNTNSLVRVRVLDGISGIIWIP